MEPDEFRRRRKAMGLTQAELAQHFGRSTSLITEWECGRIRISKMAARALSDLEREMEEQYAIENLRAEV